MKKKTFFALFSGILGIACIACLIWLIHYYIGLNRAQAEQDKMLEIIENSTTSQEEEALQPETEAAAASEGIAEEIFETVDLTQYGVTDRTIDFEALHSEENPDIYAWITVPGTVIDYPVLQHPEEMDYYLDHNVDGSQGYPGCIYTQRMNKKDWSDPNTVLYGHNMKNGTMFAALHHFKDSQFFDDNRYIHVYTEDGRTLVYEIFAAYEYSDLSLLMNFFMNSEEGRQSYFDSIWENEGMNSNFAEDVELTVDDKIITLSTCISNKPQNRYLVQGVLIAEGETNASGQVHEQ
jgi:sortase B